MSITVLGHFTAGSAPLAMCGIPSTSHLALASSTTFIQIWDMATQAQVGSNITGIGSGVVWDMVYAGNNKIACLGSSTTSYLVDLGGTVTTLSSLAGAYSTSFKQGQMAALPASNIAAACTNTLGTLIKFDASGLTGTLITPTWMGNQTKCACVTNLGTTGFIWGTNNGMIVETDTSFNLVRSYMIPMPKMFNVGQAVPAQYAIGLSYYSGYLVVATSLGQILLFNHNTGTMLQRSTRPMGTTTDLAVILATGASDQSIPFSSGFGNSFGSQVCELDVLMTPMSDRGPLEVDTGTIQFGMTFIGLAGTYGYFSQARSGITRVDCFQIGSKRSITFNAKNLSNGSQVAGEFATINDTTSPCHVEFVTDLPVSGNQQIPFTSGLGSNAFIQIGRTGTGVNELMDPRRCST